MLGAKPTKPDSRDYKAAALLPATIVQRQLWDKPIQLDQGPYGTCVANAWTHILTDPPIEHPQRPLLDPNNQPSYAKLGSSAYWVDSKGNWTGEPVAAEKYAVKLYDSIHDGVIEPLDPTRKNGCYTGNGGLVLKNRGMLKAYYRCASAEQVVQSVLAHGPVVFASPWYRSMLDTHRDSTGTVWCNVDPATGIYGYHAYVINGADVTGITSRVRLQNSWGISWGSKGVAWITVDQLRVLFMDQAFIAEE